MTLVDVPRYSECAERRASALVLSPRATARHRRFSVVADEKCVPAHIKRWRRSLVGGPRRVFRCVLNGAGEFFEVRIIGVPVSPTIRQGKVRVAQTACGVVKAERLRGLRRSTRRYVRNVTLNQARLRYAVVRRSRVGRASISARKRAIHRQKKQECLGGFKGKTPL